MTYHEPMRFERTAQELTAFETAATQHQKLVEQKVKETFESTLRNQLSLAGNPHIDQTLRARAIAYLRGVDHVAAKTFIETHDRAF